MGLLGISVIGGNQEIPPNTTARSAGGKKTDVSALLSRLKVNDDPLRQAKITNKDAIKEIHNQGVNGRVVDHQTVDLEKRVDGNKITTFYDVDGNVIYEKTTSFDGKKEKVVYYNNAGKPEKGYSLYLSNGLYGMKAFNYTPDGKENVDWITK